MYDKYKLSDEQHNAVLNKIFFIGYAYKKILLHLSIVY